MKKYVFISLIVLILFVSSCGEKTQETTPTTEKTTPTTPPGKPTQVEPPRDKLWEESECEKECEGKEGCYNQCLNKFAVIQQNLEICDTISAPLLQERCKNNVLVRKATTTNDISYCNQITDENMKQSCKTKIGG